MNTRKAVGQIFQIGHALGVVFEGVTAGTGAAGAEGVNHTHHQGLGRRRLHIVVMSLNGVANSLLHAVFFGQFGANVVVAAFDLVRDGLAHIVQKGGRFGDANIGTDLFGDHTGQMGHLD